MANTARDLIKCRISNTPGTSGNFTLSTAFTNSLLPASGDDGLAFKLNITENGVGTEIRRNCTYTHSTTTFTRGTMVRSTGTADAALNFTDKAIVSVVHSADDARGSSVLSYMRSGNLTTGVGADLAGSAINGVINMGQQLLIPANTLLPGASIIRARFNIRKASADSGAYLDVRFGPNNGIADTPLNGVSIAFNAANPNDLALDLYIAVSTGALSVMNSFAQVGYISWSADRGDTTGFDFAVDNYINLVCTGMATGNYRCTGYDMQVFR